MTPRSLPEIANQRIGDIIQTVASIRADMSSKGFLGPTIREDVKLPSCGQHAARRFGIVIDETGKMRCPEGTPNAGALTDLQMSNCMIAGAVAEDPVTVESISVVDDDAENKSSETIETEEEVSPVGIDIADILDDESQSSSDTGNYGQSLRSVGVRKVRIRTAFNER